MVKVHLLFAELKSKALINTAAQAAGKSPGFSRLIREGHPGFSTPVNDSKEGSHRL